MVAISTTFEGNGNTWDFQFHVFQAAKKSFSPKRLKDDGLKFFDTAMAQKTRERTGKK